MSRHAERPHQTIIAQAINPITLLAPPASVTGLLWFLSENSVSATAGVCSYLILQIAWTSYLFWKKRNQGGLPIFAMIASMYWIFFALALFLGERVIRSSRFIPISEDFVTQTLIMVFASVVCLALGMSLPLDLPAIRRLPDIDDRASSSLVYLRGILILTSVLGPFSSITFIFGPEMRNVMVIFMTTIAMVAFLQLLRRWWMGTASPVDKALLIGVTVVRVIAGLASGWLGPIISLGLSITALYILIHKRIPLSPILATIAAILFLQVGKEEFRTVYWGADASKSSTLERARFWVDESTSRWSDALNIGGQSKPGQLASRSLERATLLGQVAHVLETTPSQVPFQEGQTYSYLAITLIPRFLWPDKPSVNEANRFYQLAYGLSDNKSIESTSIAVGSMAEGYINFGWPGVILIMCGLGVVLRIYERGFIAQQSNTLLLTIGVALLPQFLAIEGQLGQYIGGLVQQVVLCVLIFLPITIRRAPVFSTAPALDAAAAVRVRTS